MTRTGPAGFLQTARDLQVASWVGGCDDLGAGGVDVIHLSAEQRLRLIRLRQRVNAGASATPRRLRQFDQRHARNGRKNGARLTADLLAVHEVAGVVVGHPYRGVEGLCRGRSAMDLCKPLLNVTKLAIPQLQPPPGIADRRRAETNSVAGASRNRRRS